MRNPYSFWQRHPFLTIGLFLLLEAIALIGYALF
jgi:hypothetical protein